MQDRSDIPSADERLAALEAWIRSLPGLSGALLTPASGDASFRRYFRVQSGTDSWIAMDAPPAREDVRPFVEIAGYLRSMSLNAPDIIAGDADRGFLLMTDLGAETYLQRLTEDEKATASLYADALDALLQMQSHGAAFQSRLPPYDEALLRSELALFHDWLCGRHLGIAWSRDDDANWQDVCDLLVDNALSQQTVFVHRDYHSRNLMVMERNTPGILDFQDAVEGPLTYDLVSLLKDCYFRLDAQTIERCLQTFIDARATSIAADPARIRRWFDLMGVQRHLKAAGIFARLLHRDGKAGYMRDVPQTLAYIVEVAPGYPELALLQTLIESRCLPALECRE